MVQRLGCLTLLQWMNANVIGDSVIYCKNMYDAAYGADVFALMTEWHQFRIPSWNIIRKVVTGNVIVDGRNTYDRKEVESQGFVYSRIGEKF